MTAAPAPSLSCSINPPTSPHTLTARPAAASCSAAAAASRPVGARIRTRVCVSADAAMVGIRHQGFRFADVLRRAGKYAAEVLQWRPHYQTAFCQAKFTDGRFMGAAAFLDHRKRSAHLTFCFEVAKHDHSVA